MSSYCRFLLQAAVGEEIMLEDFPKVVCLCGSTRFGEAFQKANFDETVAGRIVLTVGCDTKADSELFADKSEVELREIKYKLDWLHLRKIDLADEILVLNIGGYVGESTRREILYADKRGKRIRWLEPDHIPGDVYQILVQGGWTEDAPSRSKPTTPCTCGQRAYHWHDPSCPVYQRLQSALKD
jgi:hypothetical protein